MISKKSGSMPKVKGRVTLVTLCVVAKKTPSCLNDI